MSQHPQEGDDVDIVNLSGEVTAKARPRDKNRAPPHSWRLYIRGEDGNLKQDKTLGTMPRSEVRGAMDRYLALQSSWWSERNQLLEEANPYYSKTNRSIPLPRLAIELERDEDGSLKISEAHVEAQIVSQVLEDSLWDFHTQVQTNVKIKYNRIPGCEKCKSHGRPDVILSASPGVPLAIVEVKTLKGGDFFITTNDSLAFKPPGNASRLSVHFLRQILSYTAATAIPFVIVVNPKRAIFIDSTSIIAPVEIVFEDKSTWIEEEGGIHPFFTPEWLIDVYEMWAERLRSPPDSERSPEFVYFDGKEAALLPEDGDIATTTANIFKEGKIRFDNPRGPMWAHMKRFIEWEKSEMSREKFLDKEAENSGFPSPLHRDRYTEKDILVKYIYPLLALKGWSFDLNEEGRQGYAIAEPDIVPTGKSPDIVLFQTNPYRLLAIIEAKNVYYYHQSGPRRRALENPQGDGAAKEGWAQMVQYASVLDVPFGYVTQGEGFFEADMRSEQPNVTWLANSQFPTPKELKRQVAMSFGEIPLSNDSSMSADLEAFANNASFIFGAKERRKDVVVFALDIYRQQGSNRLFKEDLQGEPYIVSRSIAMEVGLIVERLLMSEAWNYPSTLFLFGGFLRWLSNFLTADQLVGLNYGKWAKNPPSLKEYSAELVLLSSICRQGGKSKSKHTDPLPSFDEREVVALRKSIIDYKNSGATPPILEFCVTNTDARRAIQNMVICLMEDPQLPLFQC